MMEVLIDMLQEKDAEELFKFEHDNRAYFEEMVPSRGEAYYNFESFKIRHKELLEEQDDGMCYFYLIRERYGAIIGRVNLVDIDNAERVAHVGYRIGKKDTGKGVANRALSLLLAEAPQIGLMQIYAKTTSNNIASQKVLEKNGFKQTSIGDEVIKMNGLKLRFVHYIWVI